MSYVQNGQYDTSTFECYNCLETFLLQVGRTYHCPMCRGDGVRAALRRVDYDVRQPADSASVQPELIYLKVGYQEPREFDHFGDILRIMSPTSPYKIASYHTGDVDGEAG